MYMPTFDLEEAHAVLTAIDTSIADCVIDAEHLTPFTALLAFRYKLVGAIKDAEEAAAKKALAATEGAK